MSVTSNFDKIAIRQAGESSSERIITPFIKSLPDYLCFRYPDGSKMFFDYRYLVSCKYRADTADVLLEFSQCAINLKGFKLETLFERILKDRPDEIVLLDERYDEINAACEFGVFSMEIINAR